VNEIAITDPCVAFALRRESMFFRQEFPPQQRFAGGKCPAWFCGPSWLTVLLLEAGVGADAAEKAVQWLLANPLFGNVPYRPKLVLSAGFSGALHANQRVGDLILATEVTGGDDDLWPATWPGKLPAGEWRPPLTRGRLLCLPQLVGEPEEKRRLGHQHHALAVDMETAVLARACRKKNVPFGALRVISDDLSTPLSPRLISVLKTGRVSPLRLARAVLRSPQLVGELWRLKGQTEHAARQLALGLGELLTLSLPWMENET
jgi:adenosylhomocysteine nucleosidase